MSALARIAEGHATGDDEIREWMSGNICRCAAYPQIVAALADPGTELIAGGAELVNWLKEGISPPNRLVDITGLGAGRGGVQPGRDQDRGAAPDERRRGASAT